MKFFQKITSARFLTVAGKSKEICTKRRDLSEISLVLALYFYLYKIWPSQYFNGLIFPSKCDNHGRCMSLMAEGSYHPPDPTRKLVFIIPFRDESKTHFRLEHLLTMLNTTTSYLIKQRAQFTMLVVNQASGFAFNRAKLLNIGRFDFNLPIFCYNFLLQRSQHTVCKLHNVTYGMLHTCLKKLKKNQTLYRIFVRS